MFSNRFAFFLVAVACVGAAAGGSYLATRQNIASTAQAAPAAVPVSATSPVAPTSATNASAAAAPDAPIDRAADAPVMPVPAAATPAPDPERARVAPAQSAEAKNKKAPATIVARNAAPAPARAPAPAAQPPAAITAPEPAPMPSPAPEIARQDDVRAVEPPRVEPERAPEKQFDELVVSADSVIGLQLETSLSSERARVEDRVEARVARDVRVGSHVAIPAGARVIGSVMVVEKGSKFKDRARLGIRFNTLVLGNGTRVPITTETIFRYGDPPSNSSASKIGGGAVIGTIIGGILGGGKGAAAGAAVGAGGGAVAAANADTSAAEFPAGMQMTARFLAPVSVTVER